MVSHRRGGGLAIGVTEPNPHLIWSAGARPQAPPGFARARDQLAALHPDYLRVVVDWSTLQPRPSAPPALAAGRDGCERGIGPCAPYAGLRDLFAAIASHPGLTPVVVIYGAPAWAAVGPAGCERPGTLPRSRTLTPAGLAGYRTLIRSILALARATGLELPWWSPWNEPNHPYFISPQRSRCNAHAPSDSPRYYARLVRAMRSELAADPQPHQLVLGDLAGFTNPSPIAVGVGEFVAGLPDDVACASPVWAVHYGLARLARRAEATVDQLERALARRGCPARARIWVTEAGAPTPRAPVAGAGDPVASCRELAAVLAHWNADPRVEAVFQYTFREDPLFPIGLADTRLTRLYPAYGVWRAWGARSAADPVPAAGASAACA
ncbi:MAG: hypothetical protein QOE27_1015 [Solirubrobacteraceae bacterium]|nr:hypothetical protein [Solirubrobacteraceae bacterium]